MINVKCEMLKKLKSFHLRDSMKIFSNLTLEHVPNAFYFIDFLKYFLNNTTIFTVGLLKLFSSEAIQM